MVAWLLVCAVCTVAHGGEGSDADDLQEGEDFLAFLEYLGSWDESDAEWQAFHPDDGELARVRLPAQSPDRTPGSEAQDDEHPPPPTPPEEGRDRREG